MKLFWRHMYWYFLGLRESLSNVTTGAPSRPLQESYDRGRRQVRWLLRKGPNNDRSYR